MGAVYSLFPSGYVEPTKTTTVDKIVDMPLDEQASFASKSVIMRVDDTEFAKKLLDMPAPEPVTAEYLATLAALIKAGGEHADALREKYTAAAGKPPADNPALADEQKDVIKSKDTLDKAEDLPKDTPTAAFAEEKVVEKYVMVHYCPSCGKIYRGSEYSSDEESSDDSSALTNSLD